MLADEFPQFGSLSPKSTGGSGMGLHIYIEDVDSAFDRAVKAGATVEMPVADMFWGDRYGKLADPFGHKWSIGTHIAGHVHGRNRRGAEGIHEADAEERLKLRARNDLELFAEGAAWLAAPLFVALTSAVLP